VATWLILDLCGGEASEAVGAGSIPDTAREVALRPERLGELGGVRVPAEDAAAILNRLGFGTTLADGVIRAGVPSWRADIEGEADLVEEVLRVHGYDAIPVEPNGQVAGSTLEATPDGTASCGSSDSSPDVWYTLTPDIDTGGGGRLVTGRGDKQAVSVPGVGRVDPIRVFEGWGVGGAS